MGVSYRARQFFLALQASPSQAVLSQIEVILDPDLMALFLRLQPYEQAHSIQVMNRLQSEGQTHPDLLAAALLHDVGKCLYPLRIWERVIIVLAKTLLPGLSIRWGQGDPVGWKRAFVVAQQHANWGAELAAQAGANPNVVELIRRHQDPRPFPAQNFGEQWLIQLQLADDES